VRDVAVAEVHFFIVLQPLHDLPVLADASGRQPGTGLGQAGPELVVDTQGLRRLDAITEQLAQNLHVQVEFGRTLHDRVGPREETFVAGVGVMLPEVIVRGQLPQWKCAMVARPYSPRMAGCCRASKSLISRRYC